MPAPRFAYVDETKAPAFHLVATVVSAADVAKVRSMMLERLRPNQRRIHFRDEKLSGRREHLSALQAVPVEVWVYEPAVGSGRRQTAQRAATLTRLVEDLAAGGDARVFIETDASRLQDDRRVLAAATRRLARRSEIIYSHVDPKDEPGLWVSDAVAWCWTKRGTWREGVRPLVTRIIQL